MMLPFRACAVFSLIIIVLCASCGSYDSFTHRKYLPRVFRERSHSYTNSEKGQLSDTVTTVATILSDPISGTTCVTPAAPSPSAVEDSANVQWHTRTITVTPNEPQDTAKPAAKKRTKFRDQTAKQHANRSLIWALLAVNISITSFLIGWIIARYGENLTAEIWLFAILLLLLGMFIIGMGYLVTALVFAFLHAYRARKQNSEASDPDVKKKSKLAILLAALAIIIGTVASILFFPHLLDW